jgi:hypothetical protein
VRGDCTCGRMDAGLLAEAAMVRRERGCRPSAAAAGCMDPVEHDEGELLVRMDALRKQGATHRPMCA